MRWRLWMRNWLAMDTQIGGTDMYINKIIDELNKNLKDSKIKATFCKTPNHNADCVYFSHPDDGLVARIPLKAFCISQCDMRFSYYGLDNENYRAIDKAIKQILQTPATKLRAEPKYVVMPGNLNSSHGPQLLTTDSNGRIFFAAKINGLKQTFTHDELQELIYRHADGAETSWLTLIINQYKKLV